jgi:hypothetical protein
LEPGVVLLIVYVLCVPSIHKWYAQKSHDPQIERACIAASPLTAHDFIQNLWATSQIARKVPALLVFVRLPKNRSVLGQRFERYVVARIEGGKHRVHISR